MPYTIMSIKFSVGDSDAYNFYNDVVVVQGLLNDHYLSNAAFAGAVGEMLSVDGDCGSLTKTAIRTFQTTVMGKSTHWADGRVDPGGQTWRALNGNLPAVADISPAPLDSSTTGAVGASLGNTGDYSAFRQGNYGTHLGNSSRYDSNKDGKKDSSDKYATIASHGCCLCTLTMAATAIGSDAHAVATFSIAVGDAYAGEISDLAVGYLASAYGSDSMAIGAYPIATAPRSGALGFAAISEAQEATALGFRAHAVQPGSIVLGSIAGVNGATSDASIGVGTNNPLAALHVARANGTAAILVQETAAAAAGRTLFTLANRGNTKFELKETGSGTRWQFTNSGDAFRISKFGTGQVEFQVFNNGDAVLLGDLAIGGSFTEMSDRNQKHAIVPLDGETVLAKVAQVPVSEWSYRGEAADSRHIGPMAQDFYAAFGLASGETQISARDMAGVNMAAVQALNQKLERENADIRAELDALRDTVMELRSAMPSAGLKVVNR